MPSVLLFNKPFNVLCQFTDNSQLKDQRETLADYIDQPNFYAAGRLDRDSEGLLLLTDNGALQHKISDPKHKLPKTYLVQIEGDISSSELKLLRQGVLLKDGMTQPAKVQKIAEPKWLWPRIPPIRSRQSIPTCWLKLTLTEGKNRQIRRMTAAVNHPTLRLIRIQIGPYQLKNMLPGESLMISAINS